MGGESVYRCSDGRYVGDAELWERFESGVWRACCWDDRTGREWVETRDGSLLLLVPVPESELPEDIHVARGPDGVRVVRERMPAE